MYLFLTTTNLEVSIGTVWSDPTEMDWSPAGLSGLGSDRAGTSGAPSGTPGGVSLLARR